MKIIQKLPAVPNIASIKKAARAGCSENEKVGFSRKWIFTSEKPVQSPCHVSEDGKTLFFGCQDFSNDFRGAGIIYAVNTSSGRIKWSLNTPEDDFCKWNFSLNDETLFALSAKKVIAIDRESGEIKWEVSNSNFSGQHLHSVSCLSKCKEKLFVGFESGDIYSMDAKSGKINWKFKTASFPEMKGSISAPLCLKDDGKTLFAGNQSGFLYAIDADSGAEIWKFQAGHWITSSCTMSKDGKKVYMGSRDGSVYAINAENGEKLWEFETGGWVYYSPTLGHDEKVVFAGNNKGKVYGIDTESGKQLWRFDAEGESDASSPCSVSSDGKTVFIGIDHSSNYKQLGKIYAIGAETGDKAWEFQTNGRNRFPICFDPDKKTLFAGFYDNLYNGGGLLYTFDPESGIIIDKFKTSCYIIDESQPSFSPDGETVYFGTCGSDIYALRFQTKEKAKEKALKEAEKEMNTSEEESKIKRDKNSVMIGKVTIPINKL